MGQHQAHDLNEGAARKSKYDWVGHGGFSRWSCGAPPCGDYVRRCARAVSGAIRWQDLCKAPQLRWFEARLHGASTITGISF